MTRLIDKVDSAFLKVSRIYNEINALMIRVKRESADICYIITVYLKFAHSWSYRILTDSSLTTSKLLRLIYSKYTDLPPKDYFTYDVHYA